MSLDAYDMQLSFACLVAYYCVLCSSRFRITCSVWLVNVSVIVIVSREFISVSVFNNLQIIPF